MTLDTETPARMKHNEYLDSLEDAATLEQGQ